MNAATNAEFSGTTTSHRRQLTTPGKVTLGALVALTIWFILQQIVIFGGLVPPIGLVQATGALVVAALVYSGWRWAPVAGAVWGALLVLANFPFIIADLANPSNIGGFVFVIGALLLILVVCVAGVAATVRNYSRR